MLIAPIVDNELLYVYADDRKVRKVLIDSSYFLTEGISPVVPAITAEEEGRFITYAQKVDDGEAQSLAIAKERGLPILSDDVAGMKLAAAEQVELRTTIGLIRLWSADKKLIEVQNVIKRVALRARYRASPDHPDYSWYSAYAQP